MYASFMVKLGIVQDGESNSQHQAVTETVRFLRLCFVVFEIISVFAQYIGHLTSTYSQLSTAFSQ